MLTLKSFPHIVTSRNLKSFHSCPTSTGLPLNHVDLQRICREKIHLANRVIRRFWLEGQWRIHLRCCHEKKAGLPAGTRDRWNQKEERNEN